MGFFCKAVDYWQAGVARLEKFPSCHSAVRSDGFWSTNTCRISILHDKMDSNMVGASAFEPEMAQVKVTFTTTEDGFQLPETKRQLLVPAGMAFDPH